MAIHVADVGQEHSKEQHGVDDHARPEVSARSEQRGIERPAFAACAVAQGELRPSCRGACGTCRGGMLYVATSTWPTPGTSSTCHDRIFHPRGTILISRPVSFSPRLHVRHRYDHNQDYFSLVIPAHKGSQELLADGDSDLSVELDNSAMYSNPHLPELNCLLALGIWIFTYPPLPGGKIFRFGDAGKVFGDLLPKAMERLKNVPGFREAVGDANFQAHTIRKAVITYLMGLADGPDAMVRPQAPVYSVQASFVAAPSDALLAAFSTCFHVAGCSAVRRCLARVRGSCCGTLIMCRGVV